MASVARAKKNRRFSPKTFFATIGEGRTSLTISN